MNKNTLNILNDLINIKMYCVTMYSAPGVDVEKYHMLQKQAAMLDDIIVIYIEQLKSNEILNVLKK